MRIALFGSGRIPVPPSGYGAVERHVARLAEALARAGHEVRLFGESFGPHVGGEVRLALASARAVAEMAPDVVHAHTPAVAASLGMLGAPALVYTSHSRHWTGAATLRERLGHALERRAVTRAAAVIAVSEIVRERIAAERLSTDVTVVPNGVDAERFRPRPEERNGRRIVVLGEVAPHKEPHVAAEAVAGLPAELVVAGPIRSRAYAARVAATGGPRTRLVGPLSEEDVTRTLGAADVLVHASRSESFAMAVLEAMSAGLPVVATDLLRGLVREGETGLLVPADAPEPERVACFRTHVRTLLDDPALRRRMGERAREIAVRDYSWDRVARQVASVYARARSASR